MTEMTPEGQPGQGTREAALWMAAMADRAAQGAMSDPSAIDADPTLALFKALGASTYVAGAQMHALIYIGDQVRALVALHRDAAAQGARVVGNLMPHLGQILADLAHPPRLLVNEDAEIDEDGAERLRESFAVKLSPPPPTIDFARDLLARSRQRGIPGLGHLDGCACDPICRAITEASR